MLNSDFLQDFALNWSPLKMGSSLLHFSFPAMGISRFQNGATISVSNCADSGSGLIRVTTGSNHNAATGDVVKIEDVGGTVEANGVNPITVINATTFDIDGSTFTNAYTAGGTVKVLLQTDGQLCGSEFDYGAPNTPCVQTTIANRPVYKTGQARGLPCYRYNNLERLALGTTRLFTLANYPMGFTMFCIVNRTNTGAAHPVISGAFKANAFVFQNASNVPRLLQQDNAVLLTPSIGIAAGSLAWAIISYRPSATAALGMFIANDTLDPAPTIANNNNSAAVATSLIGYQTAGNAGFVGDIYMTGLLDRCLLPNDPITKLLRLFLNRTVFGGLKIPANA